jgi:hypothetical protein
MEDDRGLEGNASGQREAVGAVAEGDAGERVDLTREQPARRAVKHGAAVDEWGGVRSVSPERLLANV